MLIKVGITGGIGSGKSVVSRLLEIMGIPVYISDTEAKRITCTDTVIRRELCALVGQEVFQGGELDWLVWNPLSLLNPVLEKKLISL